MPIGRDPHTPQRALTLAATFLAGCAMLGCAGSGGAATASDGSRTDARAAQADDTRPPHQKLGYRLEWRGFPVVAERARIAGVEFFGDLIVVRGSSNTVSVLEADSGVNRWATEAGTGLDRVYGTVRDAEGRILVSADTELTIYDDKTGTLLDRQKYSFITSTPPAMVGKYLAIGGENGQLLIHNTVSGYRQHAYDFGARIDAAPVVVGDFVAAAGRNGRVFIIDPRRGTSVGQSKVYAGVSVPPASSENAIFVASRDQSLWAFEARQGTTRWRVRTEGPLTHPPVQRGGVVYCVIPKKGLCAFDANTGDTIWESGVDADAVCTNGDRLLAWDGSTLHSIHASTGDVIDAFALPGVDRVLADAFEGGNLYTVAAKSGEIRKHSPIR